MTKSAANPLADLGVHRKATCKWAHIGKDQQQYVLEAG
jgi:hypothetical protein